MTSKEESRRSQASTVFFRAHYLWSHGMKHSMTWEEVVRLCWMIEKGGVSEQSCYVRGVSFNNDDCTPRQNLIQSLVKVSKGSYWIGMTREIDNQFDRNAVKVEAIKEGGVKNTLGYLPKDMAAALSLAIDSGHEVVITGFEFSNPLCGLIV